MPRACTESRNTNRQKSGSPPANPSPHPHIQSPAPRLVSRWSPEPGTFYSHSCQGRAGERCRSPLPTRSSMVCSDGRAQKETRLCSDITDESWKKDVRTQRLPWGHLHTTRTASFFFTVGPQHRACQSLCGTDFISAQLRVLVLRKPGVLGAEISH